MGSEMCIRDSLIQSARAKAKDELSKDESVGFFTNMFTSVGQFVDDVGAKVQRAVNDPLGTAGRIFQQIFGGGSDGSSISGARQVSKVSDNKSINSRIASVPMNYNNISVGNDPTAFIINSQTIVVMPDETAPAPLFSGDKNMTLSESIKRIQGRRLSGAV